VLYAGLNGIDIRKAPDLELVLHVAFSSRHLAVSSSGVVAVESFFGSTIGLTHDIGKVPFLEVPFDPPGTFALNSDGTRIAVAMPSSNVQVWPISTSSQPRPETWTNAAPDPVADPPLVHMEHLAWSPDGHCLAGITVDGRLTLWAGDDGARYIIPNARWKPLGNRLYHNGRVTFNGVFTLF
jgi:WD40 repeat protein